MKIGIVSDSHGDLYALKRAIELMGKVDMIIHLGDHCKDAEIVSKELKKDIIYIRGNCDFTAGTDCDKIINAQNKKILITHGHNYNVKSNYANLHYKALEEEVDMVFFGHTHFAQIFDIDNMVFVNPGSVSRPKDGIETFALVTIEDNIVIPSIVELY